jgi:uncharacterized membrane protein
MPYVMFSLFKVGLLPALAVIAAVGAIRGPLAGLLTGYLGVLLFDLVFYGVIVTFTLPALAYGTLGFVVGLASYDLSNGRSLVKLSVLSMVGMIFTVLIVVAIGITIEGYATLVAIGFVMLPIITMGLPSVFIITPLFARVWHLLMSKFFPSSLI